MKHVKDQTLLLRRRVLAQSIVTVLVGLSVSTIAQAQSADGDARALDRIVVTANKRAEDIRDVAAAVSVIDDRMLENSGAVSISDYADFVPGLQVQSSGVPGLTQISMRGIAATSTGATVATYIDQIPVGSSGLYQAAATLNLDLLPYDIQRIEVLRGPQGTLYGASAIGGLMKYVTREPDLLQDEIRMGVGFNSVASGETGIGFRLAANVPLQEDRSGLRMSFASNSIPGVTDNGVNGDQDIDGATQRGARAAYLWRGDRLDIQASMLWQRVDADNRTRIALEPGTLQPVYGDLTDRLYQPQLFQKELTLGSVTLDWDLGWGQLVSATGYSSSKTFNQVDSTLQFGGVANLMLGLPSPGSTRTSYALNLDKWTQEFRLQSTSEGAFDWMLGAFHTRESGVQGQHVWLGQRDGSPLPAPLDAAFSTLTNIALPSTYRETALFANGQWRITDQFRIDGGVRQSRNDQTYRQVVSEGILVALGEVPGASSENVFTWSVSPQFHFNPSVMAYLRAASGYQPGGPNAALPGVPATVDSSMLRSYEAGLKSEFFDRRVSLDLSAFRINWEDIQVRVTFEGIAALVNGGQATSEGFELAAMFRPTQRWQVGVNAAYTDATVKNDFTSSVNVRPANDVIVTSGLAGDRLPYIPRLSWSATTEYLFNLGDMNGQVGAAYRHVGSRVHATTNRQRTTASGDPNTILSERLTLPIELPSYSSFDVYAGIGRGDWELRAYVNNLTDERGWTSIAATTNALTGQVAQVNAFPIRPRTFGMMLDYRF